MSPPPWCKGQEPDRVHKHRTNPFLPVSGSDVNGRTPVYPGVCVGHYPSVLQVNTRAPAPPISIMWNKL